jgi:hypothetical protein
MATTTPTDTAREAIFNRLDDLFSSGSGAADPETADFDSTPATAGQIGQAKAISASTSDKSYRRLTALSNVTSFSKFEGLHACPRLFELEGLKAARETGAEAPATETVQTNLDFAFGHAVGAGIQTLATTNNLQAGQLAAFLAWKAPYDAEKLDKNDRPVGKSLAWALYSIEKFWHFWNSDLSDFEVLILPSGKPAVELAFGVDTQNGYFHFGHIDAILRSKSTGRLAVWEGKTTTMESINEATYANSYQALGYSVVVDAIANALGLDTPDYEVLYVVYSSKAKNFELLPFTKARSQRAEWLQDLLLNHAMIDKYKELGFFPKRGGNCINKFGRTCSWYGQCHMRNSSLFPGIEVGSLETVTGLEQLDFTFTLEELVSSQAAISKS